MKIEPLDRSHELYAKGYRWTFTIEGQRHYFKSRERAEERLPVIRANMEQGFGGWNGVRVEDFETTAMNDGGERIAVAAEAKAMLEEGASVEEVKAFTGWHKGTVYKVRGGKSWQHLKAT